MAILAAAATLISCEAPFAPAAPSPRLATQSAMAGRLTGSVFIEGGPVSPGRSRPRITPTPARVTATPVGGRATASYLTDTDGAGAFAFDLPMGVYELTAFTKAGGLISPQQVQVIGGATVTVKLYSYIP